MKHKEHMHHEHAMHGHHSEHSHATYKNEVEKPAVPHFGHISAKENMGTGMDEWKGEADPIAYGQASKEGCASDRTKINSQFKDYHWD